MKLESEKIILEIIFSETDKELVEFKVKTKAI